MAQRKQYQNHGFQNSGELDSQNKLEMPTISRERSYMILVLMTAKYILDSIHIFDYIDFDKTFYKFGLQNDKIKQFLNGFVSFYNSLQYVNNDQKIKWLKTRICNKSNLCEKNLFFTMLSYKYKSELLDYLNIFITAEITEIEKRNQFIEEFKNKIQLVENQIQNKENKVNDSLILNSITDEKVFDDMKPYYDDFFDDYNLYNGYLDEYNQDDY